MNRCRIALSAALAVASLLLAATPSQARFLQNDPVGYDDDMDMYTYAQNDPGNKTDPSGRSTLPASRECVLDFACTTIDGGNSGGNGTAANGRERNNSGATPNGSGGVAVTTGTPGIGHNSGDVPDEEPESDTSIPLCAGSIPACVAVLLARPLMSAPVKLSDLKPAPDDQDSGEAARNAIYKHMRPQDLNGARAELMGARFPKSGGGFWNHIKEVRDAQNSVRNRIQVVKKMLGRHNLTMGQAAYYGTELSWLSNTLDYSEGFVP